MSRVRTQPGCTLTAVTPAPSSRFARALACSTFASFDWAYASQPSYARRSKWRSSRTILPSRPWARSWKQLDTFTTRAGALCFSLSRSKDVSRKCPRWFTPICVSKPSFVFPRGVFITPALLMSSESLSWSARRGGERADRGEIAEVERASLDLRLRAARISEAQRSARHAAAGERHRRPASRAGSRSRADASGSGDDGAMVSQVRSSSAGGQMWGVGMVSRVVGGA